MNLLSGVSSFFGLDIGTTAIRLVELRGSSNPKALVKYAYVPVDAKMAMSDSKGDQQKLAQIIAQLVKQANVSSRNVAVGIPSARVFTTLADIERLNSSDLAKAIPYQADSLIPTPLAESKIDWALLGESPQDKTKEEVLLTSVPNKYVEGHLDLLESIGLNVIAFEPDNLAMARALALPDLQTQLVLDVGHKGTDLVILLGGEPRLTRSVPTGIEAFTKSVAQNLNVDEAQASQFLFKFGLSKDKLEGQVYQAVSNAVDILASEIEKSVKFFTTRYGADKLQMMVASGGAGVIPEFPLYLANKFSVPVEIGNAWRGVTYSQDRQNELMEISSQFSVAVGLAERTA